MPDKSLVEKIISNTPIALVIIGGFLVLTGAAGGWPTLSLQINQLGWQLALGIMGGIVAGTGILLLWREKSQTRKETVLQANQYGIRIVSPSNKRIEEKDRSFELAGTYTREPAGVYLQAFTVSDGLYWPISKPGSCLAADGQWRITVDFGGGPGPKTIIVALMTESGLALCKYYFKVGKDTKDQYWPGIATLTPDITECDRVSIIKKN